MSQVEVGSREAKCIDLAWSMRMHLAQRLLGERTSAGIGQGYSPWRQMTLLRWLFSPILFVLWPFVWFFDYRERLNKHRHIVNLLQVSLAEAHARRTAFEVPSEKTLEALWNIHRIPDEFEEGFGFFREPVSFSQEDQMGLLAKWIDVLYGPGADTSLVATTYQSIDVRRAEFYQQMYKQGNFVKMETAIRQLVRELSQQLPPYDAIPAVRRQQLRNPTQGIESVQPQAGGNDWPRFADFEQSERGYNEYQDAWLARRRRAAQVGEIPMAAIEEHRETIAVAHERGWRDHE